MINNNNVQDSPPGMKSYLPRTVNEFLTIKNRIEEVFSLWGYKPIMTPLLEYYDSLLVGMGSSTKKEFYKLIDYDGNILALRPEMTAPIARTVAGRIDEFELPARLSYYAPVYRYDSPQMGKNREIQQMGIELIGDHELADAEVLIVAIEAIKSTGLTNFKIDLGHTDYINGLVREFNFSPRQEERFHGYLIKKDFVGLKEFISDLQLQEKEAVNELLRLRGGEEVLDRAESLTAKRSSLAAIRTLREIYNYLDNYGVAEYVNFDLGLLRGFDYYSGVVFEAFTDRLGYTICGGGRYDNLLAQYGENMFPAVGFALGLERLRLSLQKEGIEIPADGPDCMMVYTGETAELALKLANRLHSRQIKVLLKEKKKLTAKFIEKQQHQNIKRLISLLKYQQGKVEIIKPRTGETSSINLDAGWEDKLWTHL